MIVYDATTRELGLLPTGNVVVAPGIAAAMSAVRDFLTIPDRLHEMEERAKAIWPMSVSEENALVAWREDIERAKIRANRALDLMQDAINVAVGRGVLSNPPRLPARLRLDPQFTPPEGLGAAPLIPAAVIVLIVTIGGVAFTLAVNNAINAFTNADSKGKMFEAVADNIRAGKPIPSTLPSTGAGHTLSVGAILIGLGVIGVAGYYLSRRGRRA